LIDMAVRCGPAAELCRMIHCQLFQAFRHLFLGTASNGTANVLIPHLDMFADDAFDDAVDAEAMRRSEDVL
jgi:hypothetical protein